MLGVHVIATRRYFPHQIQMAPARSGDGAGGGPLWVQNLMMIERVSAR